MRRLIFGDDRGGWHQPVELIVQASANNIRGCLLTDVDPNNTQKGLIEGGGRPKIDVEILSLHGQILGDGVFEAATTVQPTRPLVCEAEIDPPPPPESVPTVALAEEVTRPQANPPVP